VWRDLKIGRHRPVRKYARRARLGRSVTTHTLRHACATQMLKVRADLRHIQALLGHGSLATTQIYTQVEVTDLKAVHRRCHPRERALSCPGGAGSGRGPRRLR
jgi:integrase/recombinase XerD